MAQARPFDRPAQETAKLFYQILQEEHGVTVEAVERTEAQYVVRYREQSDEAGGLKTARFDRFQVEALLLAIEQEPKYGIVYPEVPDEPEETEGTEAPEDPKDSTTSE